jgi:uncharacterized protein YdaU (DUF1376 family)
MNFYPRYPAHYLVKTAHLTMEQDGAYGRLLDWYYGNERAIPHAQRYMIARATKASEKRAVDFVLNEFFSRAEDDAGTGSKSEWINERCEAEIEKAKPRLDAARANGSKGGRPRKHLPKQKPSGKPAGFPEETQQGTQNEPSTKPPQSPRANRVGSSTASPECTEGDAAAPPGAQDPQAGVPEDGGESRDSVLAAALEAAKQLRALGMRDVHPSRPELLEAIREGFRLQELTDTARELRERKAGEAPNLRYLLSTLQGRRRDSAGTNGHARAGPAPPGQMRSHYTGTQYQGSTDDQLPPELQ